MDSFLAVITRSKKKFEGKLSLSCGDLASYSHYEADSTERRISTKDQSLDSSLPRFLRPKSAGCAAGSMDRTKSRSSNELANDFDCQLAEIKEKLAKFREQDVEFHERMDSLNHSIGELASRTSSFTPSEVSAISDLSNDEDNSEEEDDDFIENEIEAISKSFSSDLLNSIPAIKVTCDKKKLFRRRQSSDPAIHEAARLLKSSVAAERPRSAVYSPDYGYLYGEEVSTLL